MAKVAATDGNTSADFHFLCEIARGGIGRVDLVMRHEGDFRRLYAIKRLLPIYEDDADVRAMLLDEARIAGLLRHPNVVSVLDVGEDEDGIFLVMDYIEGVPLTEIILQARRRGELLPVQICLRIIRQVAAGLHAAHELRSYDGSPLNLVHRDVSPQNILVERSGVVRVTDFGIAKALGRRGKTATGMLKGKMGYIAPELLRFDEPDRRSDIFSLGVVLYELVSGKRLYAGKDLGPVAKRILHESIPDLGEDRKGVPDALVGLCFELLAKQPEHRPSNARVVIERIDEILEDRIAAEGSLELEAYLEENLDDSEVTHRRSLAVRARDRVAPSEPAVVSEDRTAGGRTLRFVKQQPAWLLASVAVLMLLVGTALGAFLAGDSAAPVDSAVALPTDQAPTGPQTPPSAQVVEEPEDRPGSEAIVDLPTAAIPPANLPEVEPPVTAPTAMRRSGQRSARPVPRRSPVRRPVTSTQPAESRPMEW